MVGPHSASACSWPRGASTPTVTGSAAPALSGAISSNSKTTKRRKARFSFSVNECRCAAANGWYDVAPARTAQREQGYHGQPALPARRTHRMSISNPQRFLRFAANHYELLLRLLDARELSEGELLQLARQHLADAEADPGKLVDQLLALGFLDRVPESDRFEIPLPIERFLRYLQREHHLTSPQQI